MHLCKAWYYFYTNVYFILERARFSYEYFISKRRKYFEVLRVLRSTWKLGNSTSTVPTAARQVRCRIVFDKIPLFFFDNQIGFYCAVRPDGSVHHAYSTP
jgi:hypothetical protein